MNELRKIAEEMAQVAPAVSVPPPAHHRNPEFLLLIELEKAVRSGEDPKKILHELDRLRDGMVCT
jgi:hypothetical protein